jgi:hypothetical protein
MDPIPPSGYYYPNKFALITLDGVRSVMGQNGLNAILNLAHLSNLIDNLPPDNLEKDFDFANYSSVNLALEEMYGPRGGRGFARDQSIPFEAQAIFELIGVVSAQLIAVIFIGFFCPVICLLVLAQHLTGYSNV